MNFLQQITDTNKQTHNSKAIAQIPLIKYVLSMKIPDDVVLLAVMGTVGSVQFCSSSALQGDPL
jgi:hypothetical protein